MNPLELYEAYSAVYAPQEVDEEQLDEIAGIVSAVGRARQANG
jgi:pyrroline-5-carboxylate reductase